MFRYNVGADAYGTEGSDGRAGRPMARGRGGRRFWNHPVWAGGTVAAVSLLMAWGNADLHTPPRFDGAGYAVLGEALASGRGYREIDHPDAPRHAHFPPGYPAALAALWRATGGRSEPVAHGFSLACTAAAAAAAWRWFRTMYGPGVAWLLGMALAVNWTWGRVGGSIQSEPLFLLLEALAWLAAVRAGRRGDVPSGAVLGGLLAACTLTRHVGVALAAALVLDLLWKGRRSAALAAAVTGVVLVLPWVAWLASVRAPNQAGLLTRDGLAERVVSQALFYVQRLPDQWTGPVVEIGTVFRRGKGLGVAVNAWAALATGLIVFGWARTLRTPRRRTVALSAFATMGLLLVWPFTEAGRFLIPLVPCLLAGAVEGSAAVLAWSKDRIGIASSSVHHISRRPRAVAATAVLALSLPYSVYALATGRAEAQRRTNAGFDAACAWIAREGNRPGPVLTRHAGEVYWQTGRTALASDGDDPEAVARAIDGRGVAYLLADEERYANAPASAILEFVRRDPGRFREVWARDDGGSTVRVYEVVNGAGPRTGAGRSPHSDGSSAGGGGPNS